MKSPLMITIPHSGEKVPDQAPWLKGLEETILMCDVDRYVDRLYSPALASLDIPSVLTEWHRYAADLNRIPQDIDCTSVEGDSNPAGTHNRGFHWVVTTYNHTLMTQPMSKHTHDELVALIYEPFHAKVRALAESLKQKHQKVFHIDAHSMPSLGTSMHRDPGELRADVVVSDCKGVSCSGEFRDLVIAAYCTAGFKVAYNWPYFGGRLTEQYGKPHEGHEAIQVEMNRALYMDEKNKQLIPEKASKVQAQISQALSRVQSGLLNL